MSPFERVVKKIEETRHAILKYRKIGCFGCFVFSESMPSEN